jgi:hypothetical protein
VPLQGSVLDVPYTIHECEELLAKARKAVFAINTVISNNSPASAEELLATPKPSTCRYCVFRPTCAAYKHAREQRAVEDEWPDDIWGMVREKRALGNGRLLLVIQPENGATSRVAIRGLSPNPDRHPALPELQDGHVTAIFGLKSTGQGGTFEESVWTVVYRVETDRQTGEAERNHNKG